MEIKLLEIRDEATMFSALCINMNPGTEPERLHLRHHGYPCDGRPNIVMTNTSADSKPATNDPYAWRDRTFATAHHYIITNWTDLKTGDVVDVQFILGETATKKMAEIGTHLTP